MATRSANSCSFMRWTS